MLASKINTSNAAACEEWQVGVGEDLTGYRRLRSVRTFAPAKWLLQRSRNPNGPAAFWPAALSRNPGAIDERRPESRNRDH
jgi:hypothetical protein